MSFTTRYNEKLFQRITNYRIDVLNHLRKIAHYHYADEINLEIGDRKINYYRWMHPTQGEWELDEIFNSLKLKYMEKLIKPNSVVLDIGAHTGNMSVGYSLFAKKVISFEPNPVTFEILEQNSKLNRNIKPYNFGCSKEEGEMEFHYSDLGFNNGGLTSDLEAGVGVTGHQIPIEVYCINIDNFMKEMHSEDYNNISFIKIDCEGHDKVILPTLKKIIEKNKPLIQTEVYDGLSNEEKIELFKVIDSLGYDSYNLTSAHDNIDNLGKKITMKDLEVFDGKHPLDETRQSDAQTFSHNIICFPRD